MIGMDPRRIHVLNGSKPLMQEASPTPSYYNREFNGAKLDLYQLAEIYPALQNPALFQCAKKVLCAGERGKKDKVQDVTEARDALNRWLEMNGR